MRSDRRSKSWNETLAELEIAMALCGATLPSDLTPGLLTGGS
ncbi:alpha-hydroxy-acid oxidizing protein [Microbispora triticiradicis]|nr:alpha-hydroxy-acid oxidizing protein [Microbispora triticiradicis]